MGRFESQVGRFRVRNVLVHSNFTVQSTSSYHRQSPGFALYLLRGRHGLQYWVMY